MAGPEPPKSCVLGVGVPLVLYREPGEGPRGAQGKGSGPRLRFPRSPCLPIAFLNRVGSPAARACVFYVHLWARTAIHTGCFQAFIPKRPPCMAQPGKELDIYQFEISLAKKKRGERDLEKTRLWEDFKRIYHLEWWTGDLPDSIGKLFRY